MFPHHLRKAPAEGPKRPPRRGPGPFGWFLRAIGYLLILAAILGGGVILGPGLPTRWDPFAPLDPLAPPAMFTRMKLDRAAASPEACRAALSATGDARFASLPDREQSEACHIRGHTLLSRLSQARLAPVSTSCATALRLYMWERHSLQPAAAAYMGSGVAEIGHLSSYSCRPVRGITGTGTRMSSHATADAIDVTAVTLASGRRLSLTDSWDDPRATGFWRAARQGACRWFPTVLSPDYNALHADHFHMGDDRAGLCR